MDTAQSLCRPSRAGAATGAATGLVVWALISFVPAFHNGIPVAVTAVIPFALAWAGHVAAAWFAGPRSRSLGPAPPAAASPAPGRPASSPQPGTGSSGTPGPAPTGQNR